jgi:predicted O-methyltransferase YrrM
VRPEIVEQRLKGLPYMKLKQANRLFELIYSNRLSRCLELGFYHGVSSAYIAGALHELGSGELITIDLESAQNLDLAHFVKRYYEPTSYHWRLMKLLRDAPNDLFDFCYIDGGHSWSATGFAFCLVSKLMKPGGWVIFDDLNWTHENDSVKHLRRVQIMPSEERQSAQVNLVFDLLVRTDPAFTDFTVEGQWGMARKIGILRP